MEGEGFFEISIPTYIITNFTFHDTEIRIVNDIYNISLLSRTLFCQKPYGNSKADKHSRNNHNKQRFI
jgi:hypothetical protein